MYCIKCGKPIPDESTFCPHCGQPVSAVPSQGGSPAPADPPVPSPAPAAPAPSPTTPPPAVKKKKKTGVIAALLILIPIALVLAILIAIFSARIIYGLVQDAQFNTALTAAEADVQNGSYDQAVAKYRELLDQRPNNSTAALGLARAYIYAGNNAGAQRVLQQLQLKPGDENATLCQETLTAASQNPWISAIDASYFPTVTVTLSCGLPDEVYWEDLSVTENGTVLPVTDFQRGAGSVVFTYETESATSDYDVRALYVDLEQAGFIFQCTGEYTAPYDGYSQSSGSPAAAVNHSYQVVRTDMTWEEAFYACQNMGGHLATITSWDEEQKIISALQQAGVKYAWLGGRTDSNQYGGIYGYWITGEDFSYSNWDKDQPSGIDTADNALESYVMLWKPRDNWDWHWNDQRNDPLSIVKGMKGEMGFVCEFES